MSKERKEKSFARGIVGVLLTLDGRVVVFRDELEEDGGKWESVRGGRWGLVKGLSLVGGAVGEGEDWLEALQREMEEEIGFELKIGRDRVERLGAGVEIQVRNKKVVDFWFMVVMVRLGEEDLDGLMKMANKRGRRVVLVNPKIGGQDKFRKRFRPRDAKVMEVVARRLSE